MLEEAQAASMPFGLLSVHFQKWTPFIKGYYGASCAGSSTSSM
jgi:hypothetical protein